MDQKDLIIKKTFTIAYQNHQKSNFKVAENLYKKILKIDPHHFESIFFLGTLSTQFRKFNMAIKLFNKVIKIKPDYIHAHINLGNTFKELKKYEKSISCYERAIQINPNLSLAYGNLGVVFQELGKYQKATTCYEKAIQIDPNYAPAYNNLGIIFNALRETQKAIGFYRKAIQIQPNYAHAHNNLGMVFRELGEFENAISCFKMAIKIQTNYVAAHHNLGTVFQKMREHQKAISYFQKAIQIKLNHAVTHYNLGVVFQELGEFKKAINSYQMAVKYEPKNLAYFYYLSELKKKIINSNLKNKIYEIVEKENSTKKNIAYGNLLLSRYELKAKNYEKEFNHLLKGHRYYFEAQSIEFRKQAEHWLNKLPNVYKLINFNKSSENIKKNTNKINPIFIIGVPRCGSTLVEKIIVSGNKYIPAGEETQILNLFVRQNIKQNLLLKPDIGNLQEKIIEKYKQKGLIQEISDYTFTDKSLENFFYISLIKEIFPLAKVINCKRDVLSCIMSILKNNLTGLAWAHNLEHIFKYFNIYYKMLSDFKKKFPNFIYELEYEKLVNNPEIESKKLMEFCNLPWNNKCLEFYKRKDLISKTTSNIQIRKAIYKDSIKKYLPYKQYLNEYGNKYFWYN